MAYKFLAAAVALFIAGYGYVLFTARTVFDAAWLIAIFSIPASSLADMISRFMVTSFGLGEKNIVVDLGLLLVLGALQYGFLGFIAGWVATKLARSTSTSE